MVTIETVIIAVVAVAAGRLCILRQLILDRHSARPWRHKNASPAVVLPRLRYAYRSWSHPPARVLRPVSLKARMCAAVSLAVYSLGAEAIRREVAVRVRVGFHRAV